MDAKSKANFINSVASGQKISCPECDALNDAGSRFCIMCGSPLGQTTSEPVKPIVVATPKVEETMEDTHAFAEGLPAWDIVPPQIMVRRKKR